MNFITYIILVSMTACIVRWAISLHSYSGEKKPPMYGDYEAQRHWMEITYHLPISDWYRNTTQNDLLYWGLDYPPLTAYHSWILGFIQNRINSSWVELHSSRGHESPKQKLFMRYSVLFADLSLFVPAILFYFLKCDSTNFDKKLKLYSALVILLYPGIILIDHGHFQYNCVSLGLFVWSLNFIIIDFKILGAILFVLSLNYKQMELYHAIPFFVFYLGIIFNSETKSWMQRFLKLISLGLVVIITFVLCWIPFLNNLEGFLNVISRLFPFSRGLFEDKVSNVWCSLSIVIKLRQIFTIPVLIKICLFSTLLSMLPSMLVLLKKTSIECFKLSLINASLSFFLFSYQVHEKSILISAISIALLFCEEKFVVSWFLLISNFSMLPLYIKDNLIGPYISTQLIFYTLISLFNDLNVLIGGKTKDINTDIYWKKQLITILFYFSMFGMIMLSIVILCFNPPSNLPDLYSLLISVYSCIHFIMFLAYFNYIQIFVMQKDEKKNSKISKKNS